MTLDQFHSFVKLVRKMYNAQQESYKAGNGDRNKIAQAKALEKKVSEKLKDVRAMKEQYYTWQDRFIQVLRLMRAEQEMYYASRHEAVLQRCRESEKNMLKGIEYVEKFFPSVFTELAKQTQLPL